MKNSLKSSNGRVDLNAPKSCNIFSLYDKIPVNQCSTFRNPTEGQWDKTELSDAFFSQQNIRIIQNGIRAGVFERSKGQYTIGPQDCDELKIIMRSVFLQNAINQPNNIQEQINALNQIVLHYCVYQVYGEAQSYLKYIYDVTTLAQPIAHPMMATTSDKELILKPWF